jgi:hypothetical protein
MKKSVVFSAVAVWFLFGAGFAAGADDQKPATQSEEIFIPRSAQILPTRQPVASSAAFQLNWLSINGGGAINASSPSYQLGLSVGQSVTGSAFSPSYQMGVGFWYGVSGAPACANIKGDLNGDVLYTSSDVVLMLNCVFLGSGTCTICFADVNCDLLLTSADVVVELNRVFLGVTAPPWCGAP